MSDLTFSIIPRFPAPSFLICARVMRSIIRTANDSNKLKSSRRSERMFIFLHSVSIMPGKSGCIHKAGVCFVRFIIAPRKLSRKMDEKR